MFVHFLNDSKQGLGGGWSFMRNLEKGLKRYTDIKIAGRIEDADLCFVSGPTMVSRQTIDKVQELGKKLVVRLDNVPRNSRNRNTGTSRLKEFAERANAVVWQCSWAKEYLGDFVVPQKEVIIYNGVDDEVFTPEGPKYDFLLSPLGSGPVFLYSRFNRDETKNWEIAWYTFQQLAKLDKRSVLIVVGSFSDEIIQYNFDFFRGETIKYIPPVSEPREMATIMRGCSHIIGSYYNDCYSNTYLEALMCGVQLVHTPVTMTGGTPELLKNFSKGREYNGLQRMALEYQKLFQEV